jgi:hypothetical protein
VDSRVTPPARLVAAGAAVAGSFAVGALIDSPWLFRLLLAACLAGLIVGLTVRSPRPVLLGILVWLSCLGLVRRLLAEASPLSGHDALLLVGPVAFATLALAAHAAGAFGRHTRLSKTVMVLTVLVALSAFNPLQGNLMTGLSGLLFFVPLLAFWIGRSLCDDGTLGRMLMLAAVIAVPAAVYGLAQIFLGFPSWDVRWIETTAPGSLRVEEAIRPFATFSSSSEFGTFLGIALVCWLALAARRVPAIVIGGVLVLLGVTLTYQSSRGIVVMLVAALALMISARARLPLFAGAVLATGLLFLLPLGVKQVAPSTFGEEPSQRLLARQLEGLSDPLDPEASMVGIHVKLLANGLASVVREPLGLGVGAVTIAGRKFGGVTRGTEADPSNAAIAIGIPGLAVYAVLLGLAFTVVYGVAARDGDRLSLATLGIVTVTTFQWLNGGQYAVAAVPWLLLGWADRRALDGRGGGAT